MYWPNCVLRAGRENLPARHLHLGEMLPVVSLGQDQTRQVCMSQPSGCFIQLSPDMLWVLRFSQCHNGGYLVCGMSMIIPADRPQTFEDEGNIFLCSITAPLPTTSTKSQKTEIALFIFLKIHFKPKQHRPSYLGMLHILPLHS